jgi:hypothetical protein
MGCGLPLQAVWSEHTIYISRHNLTVDLGGMIGPVIYRILITPRHMHILMHEGQWGGDYW